MQLVAYGAQDIYLTGNPQITFFKVVYRRHTNFSMEAIEQTWNGTSDNAAGRCTATISRNGDLVHRMYFELTATIEGGKTFNPGSVFINNVELEIGGQLIDRHTGNWMETWAELTEPNPRAVTCDVDILVPLGGTLFQKMSGMGGVATMTHVDAGQKFFVPLQFWFCRNPGLALPLIALQYHEVKVTLDHDITRIASTGTNKLWCDYIYLDTDERRRFAQVSHEYLIEQVQEQSVTELDSGSELNFNHPVKELVWIKEDRVALAIAAITGGAGAPASTALEGTGYQLKLNGHDRFAARDIKYFSRVQVLEHHSGAGGLDANCEGYSRGGGECAFNDSIGVYSFALKPEEHQPSGTCNFSRIDNAQLTSGDTDTGAIVWAVNYNVLRIMSGMGGLAYSN